MIVESIACPLTEAGDAGMSPHVAKLFLQSCSMTNNAINIINLDMIPSYFRIEI